jgi:signal peptidase I
MAELKYKVVSDSMTPLIPVGAELLLEKINPETDLKKFDIIVFVKENKLTCHYVWRVNAHFDEGNFITRSLKTNIEDTPFDGKKIVGRVVNFKIGFFKKIEILFKNRNA